MLYCRQSGKTLNPYKAGAAQRQKTMLDPGNINFRSDIDGS
jgi:hypothetical protein